MTDLLFHSPHAVRLFVPLHAGEWRTFPERLPLSLTPPGAVMSVSPRAPTGPGHLSR